MRFDERADAERAGRWLRGRLSGVAAAVYPETTPVVEQDGRPAPVGPGSGDAPGRIVSTVVVTTGAARPPWDAAAAVRQVAERLAADGWTVGGPVGTDDGYEVTARRDGFVVVAAMLHVDGILRLTGCSPMFVVAAEESGPTTDDGWPGWRPASDVELALSVARSRADRRGFFGLLAEVPWYVALFAHGGDDESFATVTRDGQTQLAAFTSLDSFWYAMGDADVTWLSVTYGDVLDRWPDPRWGLALNPETPLAVYLTVPDLGAAGEGRIEVPGFDDDVEPERLPDPRRTGFRAANRVEWRLSEALAADDRDAVVDALTGAPVPVRVPVADDGRDGPPWRVMTVDGLPSVCVFTSPERAGEGLPDGLPTTAADLGEVLRAWPSRSCQLAVNPGTAIALTVPGFAVWAMAREASA